MSQRVCAALEAIPDALGKTGFVLEHHVAESFRAAGWATIGGRYYADDVDGRARELDLVAYKTFKFLDLTVVYGVLVSCKKDSENTWTFLTRDRPASDPNFDWEPVHYWTDVNPLENYLQSEKWKGEFLARAKSAWEALAATRDVFAFQQINSEKVTPKNDTAIFNSITTLMKGLDHELLALPQRQKGKKRIYFFSLLSVVDAPLVEASYSGDVAAAKEIEGITHFARYMVRKRDMSALVRFARSDVLTAEIRKLEKLAEATADYANLAVAASYAAIKTNRAVQDYFSGRLESVLGWWIRSHMNKHRISHSTAKVTALQFVNKRLRLEMDGIDDAALAFLNSDEEVMEKTKDALKRIARYEGDFEFDWDIPF